MNKGKILGMVIGILLFIVTITGFTYAYITWRSTEINKVVNSDCFIINYEKGSNINNAKLSALDETKFINRPFMTAVEGMSLANISLEIDSTCNTTGVGTIKINMTELSDAFVTGDSVDSLKYIIVENGGSLDTTIEDLIGEGFGIWDEGTINKTGETVLTTVYMESGSKYQFSVIFYLDGELVSNDAVSGVISGEISAEVTQKPLHIYKYDYTGQIETLTVPITGTYKLEVWGASGGYAYNSQYRGGYGGYSVGEVNLTKGQKVYIAVGGQGKNDTVLDGTTLEGGFNGGGSSAQGSGGPPIRYIGTGGGATHIALVSNALARLSNNINDILIVAGGGGAGIYLNTTTNGTGGDAGGYLGNGGTKINTSVSVSVGAGGSQTGGGSGYMYGSFGQGANGTHFSTGGGGGFYGGGSGLYQAGSGGGSGYIGNSLLTNKAMYCYNCDPSPESSTLTYSTKNVYSLATSKYAKIGNGYAKITLIS